MPGGDLINGVKDIGAVISTSTGVTNANDNVIKDDVSVLMTKNLPLNFLRSNCSFAVFALIAVHTVLKALQLVAAAGSSPLISRTTLATSSWSANAIMKNL